MIKMKGLHNKYSIVYDKKKKEWNLKRKGLTILSGEKDACQNYYKYILHLNVY
tara:strand:+ start:12552 stop:12710 length:159 start_codon:yes stop_codon:yes gene_type:complete